MVQVTHKFNATRMLCMPHASALSGHVCAFVCMRLHVCTRAHACDLIVYIRELYVPCPRTLMLLISLTLYGQQVLPHHKSVITVE